MRTSIIMLKNRIAVSDSIIFTGLGYALGITFPQLFHHLGIGTTFLPLFLPVVLLPLFLSLQYLILIATTLPLVNSFIFGMPPLPVAFVLIGELNIFVILMTYLLKKVPYYLSLVLTFVLERFIIWYLASIHLLPGISPDTILASYPGVIMNCLLGILFWRIIPKTQGH